MTFRRFSRRVTDSVSYTTGEPDETSESGETRVVETGVEQTERVCEVEIKRREKSK